MSTLLIMVSVFADSPFGKLVCSEAGQSGLSCELTSHLLNPSGVFFFDVVSLSRERYRTLISDDV